MHVVMNCPTSFVLFFVCLFVVFNFKWYWIVQWWTERMAPRDVWGPLSPGLTDLANIDGGVSFIDTLRASLSGTFLQRKDVVNQSLESQ